MFVEEQWKRLCMLLGIAKKVWHELLPTEYRQLFFALPLKEWVMFNLCSNSWNQTFLIEKSTRERSEGSLGRDSSTERVCSFVRLSTQMNPRGEK